MCELLKEILHAAVTGGCVFIGAWLAFRYNSRLEVARRKAAVFAAIFSVRDQIYGVESIPKAHANTLNEIRDAVAQVIAFIEPSKRDELVAAWEQYRSIPDDMLRNDDDAERQRAFLRGLDKLNIKSPREVIEAMLKYIESICS